MKFYTGTHCSIWLERTVIPLMVSHRRLAASHKRGFPRAICSWLLDSGGFSELSMFGEWRTTMREYVSAALDYKTEIGGLEGAAIQDWMCEPAMLKRTGLSIREHQRRTVISYLELMSAAPSVPWFPVLQGWELGDYLRHVDEYQKAEVDLRALPRVGLGSVCRRQHSDEIAEIVVALHRLGLNLHGFGVKLKGLEKISNHLVSADSMAWSFAARREEPLKGHHHKNCANCRTYAELWYRNRVWPLIQFNREDYKIRGKQYELFTDQQITSSETEGFIEVLNMVA
ncbi:MAG TPA: hypothetical protein VHO25_24840 [Polyangiaceae bacterium]|nr:hypothetical protein [Polyangiaceae bacterium]